MRRWIAFIALAGIVLTVAALLTMSCGGAMSTEEGEADSPAQAATAAPTELSTAERDDECYGAGWASGYVQGATADVSLELAKEYKEELMAALVEQLAKSVDIANLPLRQRERCVRVAVEGWEDGFLAYRAGEDFVIPKYVR